jgi:uncharacterized membrane protein
MKTKLNPVWQVVGIGLIAGMRSALAPAIVSYILSRNKSKEIEKSPIAFIQSGTSATILKVLAAGELVGDKLPFAPARTELLGLGGRCASGGLSGGALAMSNGKNKWMGAAMGIAAAVASTYACYYLRKGIVKHLGVNDPIIGAVEDMLAIGGGLALIKSV